MKVDQGVRMSLLGCSDDSAIESAHCPCGGPASVLRTHIRQLTATITPDPGDSVAFSFLSRHLYVPLHTCGRAHTCIFTQFTLSVLLARAPGILEGCYLLERR